MATFSSHSVSIYSIGYHKFLYQYMKKYIISSLLLLCGIVSFATAQGSSFLNDLRVGSTGTDVANLQSWLISKGYDIPAVSSGEAQKGYFGSQTKVAVMKYQAENGIPNTGFVGPLTRGRLNNVIVVKPGAPVITSINAPTQLSVGESGTVSISATDPRNRTLSYRVTWGDEVVPEPNFICPVGYTCTHNSGISVSTIAPFVQKSTFSHAYASPGTYTVTVIVVNSDALETRSTVTIRVNNSGANPLKVTSPNGGETWYRGDTQTIRWNSPNYIRATYADIKLIPYYEPCVGEICAVINMINPIIYTIAPRIPINQNSYSWTVGNYERPSYYVPQNVTPPDLTLPNGKYFIQICETGTNNCAQSSTPFTIASRNPASIVRVDSPNGGESWESQSVHQIRWSMLTNDKMLRKVDLYADQVTPPCPYNDCPLAAQLTYVLDKNIAQNAVYNWIVATDVADAPMPNGLYKIKICVAGSTTDCDYSDTAFTITPRLLRVCPDQKINNRMPIIDNGGLVQGMPEVPISRTYYILNGKRHEIAEFDANWVGQNCRVPEQTVY
jgi:peptidoglycan hydrolase-like protein with peptidoglycan-binding domain